MYARIAYDRPGAFGVVIGRSQDENVPSTSLKFDEAWLPVIVNLSVVAAPKMNTPPPTPKLVGSTGLGGIRRTRTLSKLPNKEQNAWRSFWADVDDTIGQKQRGQPQNRLRTRGRMSTCLTYLKDGAVLTNSPVGVLDDLLSIREFLGTIRLKRRPFINKWRG